MPEKVKAPEFPQGSVNEFDAAMSFMVDQISERFRNQVFNELHASTVDKFEDAKQIGNYATVFLRLAKRVQRKLLKQFDDKRIERLTKQTLSKVNNRNRRELYKRVEKAIGISTAQLTQREAMKAQTNALMLETAQWAKKLRDETMEMYVANTLRTMSLGRSLSDVLKNFDGMEEKRKNHARTVARTQVSTFNSILTKTRAQNLGVTEAVWVTSRDERVRKCHQVRNGKTFDLKKGLYSSCDGKYLLPGVDYNCRCDYLLVIPADVD